MSSSGHIFNNHPEAWEDFKSGDFASLGILFEAYYSELYYYGIKIVSMPELVKDVVQDLFVDVWERRYKMAQVDNFKAYLIVSLRRELIRRIGNIRKECSEDPHSMLRFTFSIEDFLIRDEESQEHSRVLSRSLATLTDRQREVILLRFFHGLEFLEISQVLEMNIQSVRNLLFRALEKIRKDLSDQGVAGIESVEMLLWFVFGQKKQKKVSPD